MHKELNGVPCIEMELEIPPKKQICTSRAFGRSVTDIEDLRESVATYASICAEKLRKQKSCAVALMVFIHTNNFRPDLPQYSNGSTIRFPIPTSSTIEIVKYALFILKRIYKKGYYYKKAGVIITEILPEDAVQQNLFYKVDLKKHARIMEVVDRLNSGFTRNLLTLGVQGTDRSWKLRQERLSPSYTTKLKDIIVVK